MAREHVSLVQLLKIDRCRVLPPNTQVPLGAGGVGGGTAIARLEYQGSRWREMQLKLENTGGES